MKHDDIKRDAVRFLAQQSERGGTLWSKPAGVGKLTGEEPSAHSEPVEQIPAEALEQRPSKPVVPVAKPGSSGAWERGAPEPEAVVPVQGQLENPFPAFTDLTEFNNAICNCQKCPLRKTRNHFVFGVGDPKADLLVVGEAPGADEDAKGEPFVGRAGKLLDQILGAVQLERGKGVYIANILKCRPPNNRDPLPSEVEECEPHLIKQIQLIQPKLILALGRIAAQTLLNTTTPLSKLRGQLHDYHGVPLMVTFHPAALLRNPNWKRPTWEDVQEMKRLLDEKRGGA